MLLIDIKPLKNLHSFANIWPEYSDNGWQYHTPPILPNWTPLPGRVTDNQKRWVQETTVLCPWFQVIQKSFEFKAGNFFKFKAGKFF